MTLLILLADVNGELLDLGEELGLCWIMAVLFARPLATQSQSGLGQAQEMFILCDGCLEIFFIPLLASEFRQNLERRDIAADGGQPVFANTVPGSIDNPQTLLPTYIVLGFFCHLGVTNL